MIDKVFDHIPTPVEFEAKAFGGSLNAAGCDSASFLNGYAAALYDQGIIGASEMSVLITANCRGTFSRHIEMPDVYCPVCGSCLINEEWAI